MQVNLYALFGAVLALSSLFLPWISGSTVMACSTSLTSLSLSVSPIFSNENVVVFDLRNVTLASSGSFGSFIAPSSTYFWYFEGLADSLVHLSWSPWFTVTFLNFVSFLLLLYSVFLISLCSFANGTWKKQGRRFLKACSLTLIMSIALQSLTFIVLYNRDYAAKIFGINIAYLGKPLIEDQFGANVMYFGIGFYLSVASVLVVLISWLRPKLVNVPLRSTSENGRFNHWFEISDREKSLAITFWSLLPLIIFSIIFYVLPCI
jgi:hypothetical protein